METSNNQSSYIWADFLNNSFIKYLLSTVEKEMATHSGIVAWRIPRTEESDKLPNMGSRRVGQGWVTATQWASLTRRHAQEWKNGKLLSQPSGSWPSTQAEPASQQQVSEANKELTQAFSHSVEKHITEKNMIQKQKYHVQIMLPPIP